MAASLNRAAFYAAVRTSLFGGRLKASQVAGMDAILARLIHEDGGSGVASVA